MLRIGIVGFGFMGRMHYSNWSTLDSAEVTAICDTDPDIIENSRKACGNIEGASQTIDFDNLKVYTEYEKMLSDGIVDAVSITLPTHLHPDFSIKALNAGLHVLCEKPMALNMQQCNDMIAAAEKSGNILQIGHCLRFWPEYAKTKEIIDSGQYGKVIFATFQRLGSLPTWSADSWLEDKKRSGGMILDLHIHDSDYVQYLFGSPNAVYSVAGENADYGLTHVVTQYFYNNDTKRVVTAEGSWQMMPSFGFEMSFNIGLESATICYDCTREPAFKVHPADGDAYTPEVAEGDGYLLEIAHFTQLVKGRVIPEITTLEQSKRSVGIVQAEIDSVNKNQKISIKY